MSPPAPGETLQGYLERLGKPQHPLPRRHPMARTKLHGPLDGLLKAWYNDDEAELTLGYAGEKVVLDEDDCDRLLRVLSVSHSDEQAIADLAEFFEGEVSRPAAMRMAIWFEKSDWLLEPLVYA